MASFIPCILVFLLAVNAAHGLRCYTCNKNDVSCSWGGIASYSYDTEDCGKTFLNSLLGAKCYKITAQAKDGREVVARGCITSSPVSCSAIASLLGWVDSYTSDGPNSLGNLGCDTCDTDKCNSAQRITGATFIGLILAAAIFAL